MVTIMMKNCRYCLNNKISVFFILVLLLFSLTKTGEREGVPIVTVPTN